MSRNRSGTVRHYQHISLEYNYRRKKSNAKRSKKENSPPADRVNTTYTYNSPNDNHTVYDDRRKEVVYDEDTSENKSLEEPHAYLTPNEATEETGNEEVLRYEPSNSGQRSTEVVASAVEGCSKDPSQKETTTLPIEEFSRIARNNANKDRKIEAVDTPDPYANWPSSEKIPADQRLKYFNFGVKIGYNMALDGIICNSLRIGQE